MSPSTITLLFLVFAIVMFVWEKIPLGLTAMICAIGLALTGVLDVSDAYAGFVNSNVVLCVAMFVVGQALFETGSAAWSPALPRRSGSSSSPSWSSWA